MAAFFGKLVDFMKPSNFHDNFVGDFDYKMLCAPTWNPWRKMREGEMRTLRFFPPDEHLPVFVGALMGLQHALSMMSGIINGPLLITHAGYPSDNPENNIITYIIAAGLMISGISTSIHVKQFVIPFTKGKYVFGTGVISVCGASVGNFIFIVDAITRMQQEDPSITWVDCWGRVIGTLALTHMIQVTFSFLPPKIIAKLFPGWLCGMVTMVLAIWILPFALGDFGGGLSCAHDYKGKPGPGLKNCYTFDEDTGNLTYNSDCYDQPNKPTCHVGEVTGWWGEWKFIELGLVSLGTIFLVEVFGSPFLRSIQISVGLFFGMFIASLYTVKGQSWYNAGRIRDVRPIQFFFVETFKLGIYGPLILPQVILAFVDIVNSISDIVAARLVSGLPVEGEECDKAVQGGILGDGVMSIIGVLLTSMPQIIYASNNGIIALTKCASRTAGYWIGFWLFLAGFIGHFSSLLANVPRPCLGAINIFKFTFILVAGIKLMMVDGLPRRQRIVLGIAGGYAIALVTKPEFVDRMWVVGVHASGDIKAFRNGVMDNVRSPFTVVAVLGFLLNLIVPQDNAGADDEEVMPEYMHNQKETADEKAVAAKEAA